MHVISILSGQRDLENRERGGGREGAIVVMDCESLSRQIVYLKYLAGHVRDPALSGVLCGEIFVFG